MKPHVCFVHGSLGLGGAEVLRLSVLEEMVARGANVQVVVTREEGQLGQAVRDLKVPLTQLGNRGGLLDISGVRKLSRFLKQAQPGIVQSSQFVTNFHSRLACRLAGVRNHVIEEHGIYTWKKRHHLCLDRWFNSGAQAVIACSQEVARSAAHQLKLDEQQIDVVHNCVSHQHLQPTSAAWQDSPERTQHRQSLTRSQTPPQHITTIVGTLRWEKGHTILLDAWETLTQRGSLTPEHHLLIAGDGPLREELEARARKLCNVSLLGSVSDTRQLLRASDLFVLPSVNEGFGIAIIEAMAAGLPVISTTSGGIPEVVKPNTGLLVPPHDATALANAMEQVLKYDVDGPALGAAGRQRVESKFTPAVYVNQLELIWQRLLNSTRSS